MQKECPNTDAIVHMKTEELIPMNSDAHIVSYNVLLSVQMPSSYPISFKSSKS